jgi:hypothetical protein
VNTIGTSRFVCKAVITDEHNRHRMSDLLQGRRAECAAGQDNVWRERDYFCCVSAFAHDIVCTPGV